MDRNQEYQKQKKARETFRKIVINVFIWALIIAFVSTIGVTWNSQRRNVDIFKVAQINGRIYDNRPGASFNYIHSSVREQISKNYKDQLEPKELERVALNRSVDVLQNYAIMNDFAAKNGIKPSKQMLRGVIEALTGRAYAVPTTGLIEYATMEYVNGALTGNQGDILNAFAPVTISELYSYFDLVNFTVEAEVAYFNLTNAIASRIADAELQSFYQSNISRYAGEVKVEELAVSNKATAYEIDAFAVSNGWEKTLAQYRDKAVYSNDLVLKNVSGLSKRYNLVLTNAAGTVVQKPQFENGVYHVIRVISFPDLNNLGATYKAAVLAEYVAKNYTNLRVRYAKDFDEASAKAAAMAASGADLKTVAAATGLNFVKTGKTSPINQLLRDDKGVKLDLPLLTEDTWFDAVFATPLRKSSPVLKSDAFIGIVRPVYKGANPTIDYEKIDQEVAMRWMNFKNYAATKDWSDNLRDSSKLVTYEDELEKIAKLSERE